MNRYGRINNSRYSKGNGEHGNNVFQSGINYTNQEAFSEEEGQTILIEEDNTIYELDRDCAKRHGFL